MQNYVKLQIYDIYNEKLLNINTFNFNKPKVKMGDRVLIYAIMVLVLNNKINSIR